MTLLHLYDTEQIDELAYPSPEIEITENSSALLIFTDFLAHEPLVLHDSLSAKEAKKLMIRAHVKFKFILDKKERLLGVVSLDNLSEIEFIKRTNKGGIHQDLPEIA